MDPKFIRNFCIIAHIDHGKSTLADRLLEMTGALSSREMHEQVLDSMDLERERGITIKAKSIRLHYKAKDGNTYRLNLIDTPGHVDFSYEVSRALSACEGALLVVDASQGVEAQTVANTFLAAGHNLTILPVINKIDLPAAQPEFVKEQIETVLAIPAGDALLISAKSGLGVEDVLEAIVARIPPPKGSAENPLQALIFDSWFDIYRGAVVLVRVMEGRITPHTKIRLVYSNEVYEVETLGTLTPKPVALEELEAGDVGFIVANIKRVADARMGDTVTEASRAAPALPGFEAIKPMVFAGMFPVLADEYEPLRDALGKLQLNDAAFFYEPENSVALGFWFPLRLPRLAAHGNRAGTPRARIRLESHHHRAQRALPHHPRHRRSDGSRQPREISQSQRHRQNRRAHHQGHDHHQRRFRWRNFAALPGQARHAEKL